ncbi:Hypothetical predicted protein [Cloeon dipterum]|uniref:Uncharacterized protein n=1 Tax=Cloeon dipterum TaxID=197152 RepID=A0A8S1DK78_9INSE|nr:Hypothetical predicted protein [Cloeon dipterum]
MHRKKFCECGQQAVFFSFHRRIEGGMKAILSRCSVSCPVRLYSGFRKEISLICNYRPAFIKQLLEGDFKELKNFENIL